MKFNLPAGVWLTQKPTELISIVERYFVKKELPGQVHHSFPVSFLGEKFDVKFSNPILTPEGAPHPHRQRYVTVTYGKLGLLVVNFNTFELGSMPPEGETAEYTVDGYRDENGMYWPDTYLPSHILNYLTTGEIPVSPLLAKSNHGAS